MDSEYCWDVEVKRVLEPHEPDEASVIPVVIRDVDGAPSPLAQLQALPTDGRPISRWRPRDRAWAEVVRGLREALEFIQGRTAAKWKKIG